MTDPHEPIDDEVLSADLDGAADPSEHARIAGDPEAQARQDQLRAAAALVGQPVEALPAPTVDALIARATDAAGGGADDGGPIPLRPPGGRRGRRLPPPWSVAATILILVVVGLSLVWRGRAAPHGTSAARTASAPASAAAGSAPSAAPSSNRAPPGSTAPQSLDRQSLGAVASITDLGSFGSDGALRSALRNGLPRPAGASAAGAPMAIPPTAVIRCATVIENTGLPVAQRLQVAVARVAGVPLIVYEYRASAAATAPTTGPTTPGSSTVVRTLIAVVDPATCKPRVLFIRP